MIPAVSSTPSPSRKMGKFFPKEGRELLVFASHIRQALEEKPKGLYPREPFGSKNERKSRTAKESRASG